MKESMLGVECGIHGEKLVVYSGGESLKKMQHSKDLVIN
jgi:hypothetical protein